MTEDTPSARPFFGLTIAWLVLACIAGATGGVAALKPPLPQVMIGAITLALVLAGVLHPALRRWLAQVNLRGFVAFHLTRFVGVVFLLMSARGQLTGEFAIPAGWGDIVVAIGALAIVTLLRDPLARPGALMLWNALGLADILAVVVIAAKLGMRDPSLVAPLLRFPMSLVPTFVVPMIVASHVLIDRRLRAAPPRLPAPVALP
jgi:hypothetical protein